MSHVLLATVLVLVGILGFALSLLVRRTWTGLAKVDSGPPAAVLSYVAAAFGILIGFVIVFLVGQVSDARVAIGDEATSIGTAFDEAQLFPDAEPEIQHALICYSEAVSEREWPAMADGRGAPAVDAAYRTLIATYGEATEPTDGTFQPAAATNSFVQLGGISTAREERLVVAQAAFGPILFVLLFGSAAFVLVLLFVVSRGARPVGQAVLMGMAAIFTTVLLLVVVILSNPYREGTGPLTPRLIDENTERMVALAPEVAEDPCPFEERG